MSEQQRNEIIEALEAALLKVEQEPRYAHELLVGAGILNDDKTFTEAYQNLCTEEDLG